MLRDSISSLIDLGKLVSVSRKVALREHGGDAAVRSNVYQTKSQQKCIADHPNNFYTLLACLQWNQHLRPTSSFVYLHNTL